MLEITSEKDFELLETELKDRFGTIPQQAENAILYYRLNMLVKTARLETFNLKKGVATLEFNNQNLPGRDIITGLLQDLSYPVKLDGTGNLKIVFDLNNSGSTLKDFYHSALEILRIYLDKTSQTCTNKGNN